MIKKRTMKRISTLDQAIVSQAIAAATGRAVRSLEFTESGEAIATLDENRFSEDKHNRAADGKFTSGSGGGGGSGGGSDDGGGAPDDDGGFGGGGELTGDDRADAVTKLSSASDDMKREFLSIEAGMADDEIDDVLESGGFDEAVEDVMFEVDEDTVASLVENYGGGDGGDGGDDDSGGSGGSGGPTSRFANDQRLSDGGAAGYDGSYDDLEEDEMYDMVVDDAKFSMSRDGVLDSLATDPEHRADLDNKTDDDLREMLVEEAGLMGREELQSILESNSGGDGGGSGGEDRLDAGVADSIKDAIPDMSRDELIDFAGGDNQALRDSVDKMGDDELRGYAAGIADYVQDDHAAATLEKYNSSRNGG